MPDRLIHHRRLYGGLIAPLLLPGKAEEQNPDLDWPKKKSQKKRKYSQGDFFTLA
jgi:hypothetical protein